MTRRETLTDVPVVRASLTRTARRIFAGTVCAELSRVRGLGQHCAEAVTHGSSRTGVVRTAVPVRDCAVEP
jgi:hypothetical protein